MENFLLCIRAFHHEKVVSWSALQVGGLMVPADGSEFKTQTCQSWALCWKKSYLYAIMLHLACIYVDPCMHSGSTLHVHFGFTLYAFTCLYPRCCHISSAISQAWMILHGNCRTLSQTSDLIFGGKTDQLPNVFGRPQTDDRPSPTTLFTGGGPWFKYLTRAVYLFFGAELAF